IVFENTDTMRFQVQEMARAERMLTDDAIAGEDSTYNELIPDPGELSATLFIELTSDELLREWLPKMRLIEFGIRFDLGPSDGGVLARSGLSLRRALMCLKTTCLLDAQSRGERNVRLIATARSVSFVVERSVRIAQLVIPHIAVVDWKEVDSLDTTDRDTFGF